MNPPKTDSEYQREAERMANGLLRHASFHQNFGHHLCHDPNCGTCKGGAIIICECLDLALLLRARDKRDQLHAENDALKAQLASLKTVAKAAEALHMVAPHFGLEQRFALSVALSDHAAKYKLE